MSTLATRSAYDAAYADGAPRSTLTRLYAADLEATSAAYAIAADAPGLRKDAARYLFAESLRLHNEAGRHVDRADELEEGAEGPDDIHDMGRCYDCEADLTAREAHKADCKYRK